MLVAPRTALSERAGVASYWIVDPIEPRLTVCELRQEQYVEVADVTADQEWTSVRPFRVTVRLAALLD